MNVEEQYISAIRKSDDEHRKMAIGILKEIKRMKEEGYSERSKEILEGVFRLREVLGLA